MRYIHYLCNIRNVLRPETVKAEAQQEVDEEIDFKEE